MFIFIDNDLIDICLYEKYEIVLKNDSSNYIIREITECSRRCFCNENIVQVAPLLITALVLHIYI